MSVRMFFKVPGVCLYLFIGSFSLFYELNAQAILCEGNLGNNIFTEGDFGRGTPVVVQANPGLAPGFIYTTQVPPDDGEYTLTNNMAAWPSIFGSWLEIGDHDPDPNGYMMVVNASFAPGVFYEKIIDDLCENTLYEFSADVINIIKSGTTGHILPNVSFYIDDVLGYSSGTIPQDEKWHTYGFTFTTGPGQSVAKLSLINNAPGGIGNDLALDNISFRPCGPSSSVSIDPEGKICENSLFPLLTAHIDADTGALQWQVSINNGLIWNDIPGATDRTHQVQQLAAGSYVFRYIYSNSSTSIYNPKCRIVSDTIVVDIVPVEFLIKDTLCEGMTYNLGGVEYGETGIYQEMLTASNGCDSVVTLDLLVFPDPPIMAEFGTRPPSCLGASDGSIFIISVDGTPPPYIFIIGDSLIPPPNLLVDLLAGAYIARIENEYGCFDEDTVIVNDGPELVIQTNEDTTIRLGHPVFLHTQTNLPVISASWSPAETVSCPFCLSTQVTPPFDQTYIVEAVSEGGCIDQDSVTIRVDRTPVFYTPNIFTPNGDQVNDHFTISVDPFAVTAIDEVLIFDRWGGLVERKASLPSESTVLLWDGETPHGQAQNGIYIYIITYRLADGSQGTVHGDITLLR